MISKDEAAGMPSPRLPARPQSANAHPPSGGASQRQQQPPPGGGGAAPATTGPPSTAGTKGAPVFPAKPIPQSQFYGQNEVPQLDLAPLKMPDTHVTAESCLEEMERVLQTLAEKQEDPMWVTTHVALAEAWRAAAELLLGHAVAGHEMLGDLHLKQQEMFHNEDAHQQQMAHNDQQHYQKVKQSDEQHQQQLKHSDTQNQLAIKQTQAQHAQQLKQGDQQHAVKIKQAQDVHSQRMKTQAQKDKAATAKKPTTSK